MAEQKSSERRGGDGAGADFGREAAPVSGGEIEPAVPRVSVITIFLNEQRFLAEAVASVFAQTLAGWELLLVDDGSTDGSSDIARRFAARDPRVRYLEHPCHENRGMSTSRNLGLRFARGEYVAFLDADDVWRPDKLERQVAMLDARPAAAMVQGAPLWWYGWTGDAADARKDQVKKDPDADSLILPPRMLLEVLTGERLASWPSDAMLRRRVVDAVGGFEDVFRGMHEDQAFFAKVQLRHPVFVSGESWLKYRMHEDSCYAQSKRSDRHRSARLFFLRWLESYLARQSDVDRRLLQVVREKLRPFRLTTRLRQRIRRVWRIVSALSASRRRGAADGS